MTASMAGNMATCWIIIGVWPPSTIPAQSSAMAAKLGTNIAAVISHAGAQPWPR